MASLTGNAFKAEPIHLPIMSRLGERDEAERHGHNIVGDVPTSESRQSADRAGEEGHQEKVYSRRERYAQGQAQGGG